MLSWPYKDPSENIDYAVDWSGILPNGDSIETVVWFVPEGLTKGATHLIDETAIVWLSGGQANVAYNVSCRIETTAGRVFERTVRLIVQER